MRQYDDIISLYLYNLYPETTTIVIIIIMIGVGGDVTSVATDVPIFFIL